MLAFGNYTFETSLFAMLVALGVFYLLLRLLILFFYSVNPLRLIRLGKDFNSQRLSKKRTKTVEGLLAFTRQDWAMAYGLLTRGSKQADASIANYLAAAYAAHELGNREAWMKTLEEAQQEFPSAKPTIQSLKAQLFYKSNQLEQCLAVLEQEKKGQFNEPSLITLLKDVYVKLEEWSKLNDLIPLIEKKKILEVDELESLKLRIFMEQLYSTFEQHKISDDKDSVVEHLTKQWKKAPSKYREDEMAVKHYSDLLLQVGEKPQAAKAIESALDKNWSSQLVLRYAEKDFDANQQQLLVAESWLKARPANAELLLSLGRICLRNQLWGKAKEYYLASIKIAPTAAAYGELSKLLKGLGHAEESEAYFDAYMTSEGSKLLELPMPDIAIDSI